jgi:Ca2+-binding EF-hand superfamily protein
MKHEANLVLVVGLLAIAIPAAHAAKPAKAANKNQRMNAAVIAKYDKNGNGFIDADEVEAIQKAFKNDPDLKRFDTNGDGKLDETEVSAINPTPKKKKK